MIDTAALRQRRTRLIAVGVAAVGAVTLATILALTRDRGGDDQFVLAAALRTSLSTPASTTTSSTTTSTTAASTTAAPTTTATTAAPTTPPTEPPTTTPPTTRAAPPASAPRPRVPFNSSVTNVGAATLHGSWRSGCPVGPDQLRMVSMSHWDFGGQVRTGRLVVHRDHANGIVSVMRRLFEIHYPIARMEPVDVFGGSDDASMAANNTSAFNCRRVAGSDSWSEHAYGRAIDVNPVQNPYVRGSYVSPPAGRDHVDRSPAPGRITSGDAVIQAFSGIGWSWGGYWSSSKDYQHFSSSGR